MSRLKTNDLKKSDASDTFDFDVYPFFGVYLSRPERKNSGNKLYWRVQNPSNDQLLNFDVEKESGLITGLELIVYFGKISAYQQLRIPREKSDARLSLVREGERELRSENSPVDATDYIHEISFAISGNSIQLGFFDGRPSKMLQVSERLSLLTDANNLVVGVEIGGVPTKEIDRMTGRLTKA